MYIGSIYLHYIWFYNGFILELFILHLSTLNVHVYLWLCIDGIQIHIKSTSVSGISLWMMKIEFSVFLNQGMNGRRGTRPRQK